MTNLFMKILCAVIAFILFGGSFLTSDRTSLQPEAVRENYKSVDNSDSTLGGAADSYVVYDDGLLYEEAAEVAAAGNGSYQYYSAFCPPSYDSEAEYNNEKYESTEENGFRLVQTDPLSTFAADVDTASYANVRRMIEDGWSLDEIYADAVRPEEFVNYFSYDLEGPEAGEKFGVTRKIAVCPWNKDHQLLFIGMKTQDIDLSEIPDQNLVFLIDVSGSMSDDNKLPLLKKSFLHLLEGLDENDTVSIVTYASGVETVLDGVKCDDKEAIRDALDALEAGGGTYGEGGIQRAYEIAERNFLENGNNRIILATDGDLNIGISEPDQLEKLVEEKRDTGVYLSVLGFGMYNYRDDNMERLADCGDGNYAYIDSLLEAKKVLVQEMGSTLLTVADDVKLQVEFNPEKVNAYRLIGYENRLMNAVDFRDDTKDAGEIGAGHSVIALYELIPTDSEQAVTLKYQGSGAVSSEGASDTKSSEAAGEYATVYIRYKEPGEQTALECEYPVSETEYQDEPDDDLRFAAAAAEFAMILRDSDEKGEASLGHLMDALKGVRLDDEYRQEMNYLVRRLAGQDY